ncbi:methyltransferase domain-containing protein [Desulfobotulus sp. H1]|uniref:Arsenite methyltransferase n=1 Tax=Desulfobotulus pelophilus TaxID=2823377 RepID=A0ABT3NC29_9BACT|nr:methyltransferase domain-containing protein [Desulfobotulus pelophilus]MCW7755023.1 methyltransferase domain-containing protein [Desulfobotulus pelophilus]
MISDKGAGPMIRHRYGAVASAENRGCCSDGGLASIDASRLGYSAEEAASVPGGSNLGLGCGNPVALASIKPGEVVLDLGSGAGFDAFLAAERVGETGLVIGVDMTPEMVDKARANAEKAGKSQLSFRLGEIEYLPVADASVDVIISNCVLNLSARKDRVLEESFRVLRQGGRLAISDVVQMKPFSSILLDHPDALCA